MEDTLIFVGYRQFTSTKNGKDYFVVDFITQPKKSPTNGNMISKAVPVFTDKNKFSNFVQNNKLLTAVKVPFEINGDKVNYLI